MNFLVVFISHFLLVLHPFHVAIIEINHNPVSNVLEIGAKVFIEDLESALKLENNSSTDLIKEHELKETTDRINTYFQSRMSITVDGNSKTFRMVGSEIEGDALWVYFEISKVKSLSSFGITCKILHELQENHENIVHVKYNKNTKTLKLSDKKESGTIKF